MGDQKFRQFSRGIVTGKTRVGNLAYRIIFKRIVS
jgi:hypothetical protein